MNLVSNGLDIIKTICDYAGVIHPENEQLNGMSVRKLAQGEKVENWRNEIRIESEFGHAIIRDHYKYVMYDTGKNRKQTFDLKNDPGEMKKT